MGVSFNIKEVFNRYTENDKLSKVDIFHLYDTGEECVKVLILRI